jgi:lysozyme family protein
MLTELVKLEQSYAFDEYNRHRAANYKSYRQYARFGKGWLKRIPVKKECEQRPTEREVFG